MALVYDKDGHYRTKKSKTNDKVYKEVKSKNKKQDQKYSEGKTRTLLTDRGAKLELPVNVYNAFMRVLGNDQEWNQDYKADIEAFIEDMEEYGVENVLPDVEQYIKLVPIFQGSDTSELGSSVDTHERTDEEKQEGIANKKVGTEIRKSGIEPVSPDSRDKIPEAPKNTNPKEISETRNQAMGIEDVPIDNPYTGQIKELLNNIDSLKGQIANADDTEKVGLLVQLNKGTKELDDLCEKAGLPKVGPNFSNQAELFKALQETTAKNSAESKINEGLKKGLESFVHDKSQHLDTRKYRDDAFAYEMAQADRALNVENRAKAKENLDRVLEALRNEGEIAASDTGTGLTTGHGVSNDWVSDFVDIIDAPKTKSSLRKTYSDRLDTLKDITDKDYIDNLINKIKESEYNDDISKYINNKFGLKTDAADYLDRFKASLLKDQYSLADALTKKARLEKARATLEKHKAGLSKAGLSKASDKEKPIELNKLTPEELQAYNAMSPEEKRNFKPSNKDITGSLTDENIDTSDAVNSSEPKWKSFLKDNLPDWIEREKNLINNQQRFGTPVKKLSLKNTGVLDDIIAYINKEKDSIDPELMPLVKWFKSIGNKDISKLPFKEKYLATMFDNTAKKRAAKGEYDKYNQAVKDAEEKMRNTKDAWELYGKGKGISDDDIIKELDRLQAANEIKYNEISAFDRNNTGHLYYRLPELKAKISALRQLLARRHIGDGRNTAFYNLSDGSGYGLLNTGAGSTYPIFVKKNDNGKWQGYLGDYSTADQSELDRIRKDSTLSDQEKFEKMYHADTDNPIYGVGVGTEGFDLPEFEDLPEDFKLSQDDYVKKYGKKYGKGTLDKLFADKEAYDKRKQGTASNIKQKLISLFGGDFGGSKSKTLYAQNRADRNQYRAGNQELTNAEVEKVLKAKSYPELMLALGYVNLEDSGEKDEKGNHIYRAVTDEEGNPVYKLNEAKRNTALYKYIKDHNLAYDPASGRVFKDAHTAELFGGNPREIIDANRAQKKLDLTAKINRGNIKANLLKRALNGDESVNLNDDGTVTKTDNSSVGTIKTGRYGTYVRQYKKDADGKKIPKYDDEGNKIGFETEIVHKNAPENKGTLSAATWDKYKNQGYLNIIRQKGFNTDDLKRGLLSIDKVLEAFPEGTNDNQTEVIRDWLINKVKPDLEKHNLTQQAIEMMRQEGMEDPEKLENIKSPMEKYNKPDYVNPYTHDKIEPYNEGQKKKYKKTVYPSNNEEVKAGSDGMYRPDKYSKLFGNIQL